jgi:hypothetical protein
VKAILGWFLISVMLTTQAIAAKVTVTPILTVTEQYTDNIDLVSDDNKEHEFITIISPGITLEVLERTSGLTLNYAPAYAAYSRFSENNTWRHNASAELYKDLTRYTQLKASDNFVYTEDPVSETDPTLRTGRNRYWTNSSQADIIHRFGPEDNVDLKYEHTILKNVEGDQDEFVRHGPSGLATYWFSPPKWGIEAGAKYEITDYNESDDSNFYQGSGRLLRRFSRHLDGFVRYVYSTIDYSGVTDEDYRLHEAGLGVDYTIGDTTDASVAASYLYRDFDESDDEYYYLVSADITHTWEWPRSSISVSGGSGYNYDILGAENLGFAIYAEGNGSVEYRFTRQLSGDLFGGYHYLRYLDQDPERQDNIYETGAGLTYQAVNWAAIRFMYRYRRFQSDAEADVEEYQENRVLLGVVMSKPWKIK